MRLLQKPSLPGESGTKSSSMQPKMLLCLKSGILRASEYEMHFLARRPEFTGHVLRTDHAEYRRIPILKEL